MAIKYMDDDENIKAMRETAREVGLVKLLEDVYEELGWCSDDLEEALKLLGSTIMEE